MLYLHEQHKDLFSVPSEYVLAHCISADFALGAGIARQFQYKYQTRSELKQLFPHYHFTGGDCILTGTKQTRMVYNLVTKARYWEKPTYETLKQALENLYMMMVVGNQHRLAIPRIGCGLDRLNWEQVLEIIKKVFDRPGMYNIEILVCYQ